MRTLALAALVLLPVGARAADTHRLAFAAGYVDHVVRDEAATALRYHGALGAGDVTYLGERPGLRWVVELGASGGPQDAAGHPGRTVIFTSAGADGEVVEVAVPMRGRQLGLDVGGALHARIRFASDRVVLRVGGGVAWDLAMPDGFARPGLHSLVSLRPALGLTLTPHPRHTLDLDASQALLGVMTRMPYHQSVSLPETGQVAGLFAQGTGVRTPADLLSVRADVRWLTPVQDRVAVGLRYRFTWLSDREPRPLRLAQHGVAVVVEPRLGRRS